MALKVFALLADGEVFMRMSLDTEQNELAPMWIAGLQSDPKVVEVTDVPHTVDTGWQLVDGEWIEPAE